MNSRRLLSGLVALVPLLAGLALPAWAQEPPRAHSTTGPVPPAGAVSEPFTPTKTSNIIPEVPVYLWYHGCGPTALGMVAGYFDGHGFPDLIPGDASTQTPEVNQVIGSGGARYETLTPEQHNEDYAKPWNCDPDDYITAGRTPHADNCLADFAHTSRTSENMCYGWTWSDDMGPGFEDYTDYAKRTYEATATDYFWPGISTPELTFDILKTEIDNNRPMVFLVDANGSGTTDHFVTVIGYNEGGEGEGEGEGEKYIYLDTWNTTPQQAVFRGMSDQYTYGIWGAQAFSMDEPFQFIQEPIGGRKVIGATLTLEVAVACAEGEVSYQWLKDGALLPGAASSTYIVEPLSRADEGWYTCRATDASEVPIESTPVFIQVVDGSELSSAGIAGLSGLILALGGLVFFILRPRREGAPSSQRP